jgi:hypothetical protein
MREWDESKTEFRNRRNHERREQELKGLAPEMRCPFCAKVKLRTRQWIIVPKENAALLKGDAEDMALLLEHQCACKSCYMQLFEKKTQVELAEERSLNEF